MTRSSWGLIGIMMVTLGAAALASHRGLGVPQPDKQPVSVREGSTRSSAWTTGHRRTRYFVGGGMHGGK